MPVKVTTLPKESGIYYISFKKYTKGYIGSSCNINRRANCHLSSLRNNKHYNSYLQNIYNKYGENNMIIKILEKCSIDNLLIREQYYIDNKDYNSDINVDKIVDTNNGYRLRKEIRDKVKNSLLGRKLSPDRIEKLRKSHLGKKLSKETKLKMSIAQYNSKRKRVISNKDLITIINKFNSGILPKVLYSKYNIKKTTFNAIFRNVLRKNLTHLINKDVLNLYNLNHKKLYKKEKIKGFNFVEYLKNN